MCHTTRSKATKSLLFFIILALVFYPLTWSLRGLRPMPWSYRRFDGSLFRTNFNASEWSHRGLEFKSLADWGLYYAKYPAVDRSSFFKTIERRYGFLETSLTGARMYNPWLKSKPTLEDTGIVISLGSKDVHLAAHLIANLRTVLHSELPIEIAYAGDEDLTTAERQKLASIAPNVKFLDLLHIFPRARDDLVNGGWATKPFALLAASHARTILVDADTIFLQKPDAIFEEQIGVEDTGALFFHDRVVATGETKRQQFIMDQLAAVNSTSSVYLDLNSFFWRGKSRQEADSGLVAVDKSRPALFMGVIFACWLNTKSIREQVTYKRYHGDKETFWIAMELSKAPYTFPPWYAGQIGKVSEDPEVLHQIERGEAAQVCGQHMLHVDTVQRKPLWFNGGIYEHKRSPSRGYAKMTHWWLQSDIESPSNVTAAPQWRWIKGVACLSEKGVQPLDDEYRDVLSRTIQAAISIDEAMDIKAVRS
ncbi:glycosyltransferase family 71 protein [Myriangium duriaei CBS 260.36]|uniref:Glycosyltransferase family 71 protein n=1 Tax=Myriangium duriaei CBS 260.36 TaxID=1168546 RepID=A0A9P4J4V2_9PEZI|nr:glycosyltransferase family 71 protein [Myriangium duriaei CBS 260.36]